METQQTRVHDVIIRGNTKTKDCIIEAEAEALMSANTKQELELAAKGMKSRLKRLNVFDSVKVTPIYGPPELPGTSNVIIEVVEATTPLIGQIDAFKKPETRCYTVEGSLNYKNLFGYGDLWKLSYGRDLSTDVSASAGVSLPRFGRLEFDLPCAIPLGFYRAALNFGVSAGVIVPPGKEFLNKGSSIPERFFLGENASPVCTFGGPTTLWGFKTRGLGPTEPRREINAENTDPPRRDYLGGDLAFSAFADLSFDLPWNPFRKKGIHAQVFESTGNVSKLWENNHQNFSVQKFRESI